MISKAEFLKEHKDLVEVVELDFSKPESIDAAFQGIEKVFFMSPPGYTTFASPLLLEASKSKLNFY